ncbi:PREDICTED: reticulon-like protein B21 [Camelina sativa]|uniref:Reticulon-like protein n=1 Tax=Camelina sativa TaxID=90675 RepID=A0ABM0V9Q6_CAMSA|nr:PREDICTED: reticulon-like protein B21 [Camelina sativa]
MDPSFSSSRRRRIGGTVVAAGSVWETRMQSDDEVSNTNTAIVLHHASTEDKKMSLKEEALGVNNGKRRPLKSRASDTKNPSSVEIVRASSMKLTRPRSIGTPPMTPRRSVSSDDKSPNMSVVKKTRSESVEGVEKTTPGRVKKIRSELCTAIVKAGEFDSVALRKVNSLPPPNSEKPDKKTEHLPKEETVVSENSKIPDEVKEFGVCQEIIVSAKSNVDEQIDNDDHEEEEDEEEEEEEREVEKKSVDVKEMNVAKENRVVGGVETTKFSQFHNRATPSPSSVRKISPPVIKKATSVYSVPLNSTPSTDRYAEGEEEDFTQSQSKLQSLVDLVMWRDASRSTLVFGFGTFLIISSSYANDLNFSFISVVAYMGLIYLGVMFVLKSLIYRGVVEERQKIVGVREEDVKRMLRLIMPYLNESIFQLRALFSGDPSTTLKMGVVLFVLARCGSSITLWNLAKFGFLGAFTMPKIFISYSTHFSAYGNFWIRRFRDAWESCNHKKAVALALFTLVWNLSSVTARVWAAFMLFVALRYYQQNMIWSTNQNDDDDDDENIADEEDEEEELEEVQQVPKFKKAPPHMMMMPNKLKKIS